jgi:photosystem II stability/assembly factor-like uncharacterized protein
MNGFVTRVSGKVIKRFSFATIVAIACFLALRHFQIEFVNNDLVYKSKEKLVDPNDDLRHRIEKKRSAKRNQRKLDSPNAYADYHNAIRTRKSEKEAGYPTGYVTVEHRKAKSSEFLMQHKSNVRVSDLDFIERGPSNVPGRTRAILVIESDPDKNTWFAGGVGGGIWKTEDGGNTWNLKTPDIPSLAITWLADCAADPNILYAVTGEAVGGGRGLVGNGVLRSADGGDTWEVLPTTLGVRGFSNIWRIIVDQDDPNTVIICTTQGEWETELRSEIYKSEDGGETWTKKYNGSAWISQVVAHPGDFSTIYAAYWGSGVLKSMDAGETWFEASRGMDQVDGRVELAIAPSDPSRLYAAVIGSNLGGDADLYVSLNAGEDWGLIEQSFQGETVDFFRGQGNYDNTIAVNPYNPNEVYYGGVNLWKSDMSEPEIIEYPMFEVVIARGDDTFWDFGDLESDFFDGKLSVNIDLESSEFIDVEIRTGAGISQFAHRFKVDLDAEPASSVQFFDYVEVPFEAWDITNDRQLMVSFNDQQEDGFFNLIPESINDADQENDSREYMMIHMIPYDVDPNENIARSEEEAFSYRGVYFMWPFLREGYSWEPEDLLADTILIDHSVVVQTIPRAQMSPVSDAYGDFEGELNPAYDPDILDFAFHPDHHNLIMIPVDDALKTFRILNANDGGVYLSNTSRTPGTQNGDWTKVARGYNTTQFYSAAKKPLEEVFMGGTQDNGTWKSPDDAIAQAETEYDLVWGGDGFDVLWNYADPDQYIVSVYNNTFYRTDDNGETWSDISITSGFGPFFSKLSSSNSVPESIYSVSSLGVHHSRDFGGRWVLTSISEDWGFTNFIDLKVSLSNPNIIWAGSGMDDDQRVHVSTDGARSFHKTNNFEKVELGYLSGMATHPERDSTAYILFSFAKGPKILRTTDLGESWEDISGFDDGEASTNGFPDVAVYCLLVRPDNTDVLWAGTEIGIFESTDNGISWHFHESEMGAAAVWDMNVRDDTIVIATHGRGIFTATLPESQEVVVSPLIVDYGTSPKGELVLDLSLRSPYDSTIVHVEDSRFKSGSTDTGTLRLSYSGTPVEEAMAVSAVSYKDGDAYPTDTLLAMIFAVNTPVAEYVQDFEQETNDFIGDEFTIRNYPGFSNRAIHSPHPYLEGNTFGGDRYNYLFNLKTPIIVDGSNATFQYDDVAIVEPGDQNAEFPSVEFWDYVVIEGTKNGLDWIPLAPGYDANTNSRWLEAFLEENDGNASLYITQNIDLRQTFSANDTILIRFRLFTDPLTAGWGWTIDNLLIQQTITGIDDQDKTARFDVYPNPVRDEKVLTLTFEQALVEPFAVSIVDVLGRPAGNWEISDQGKANKFYQIDLQNLRSGMYVLSIEAQGRRIVRKVLIE